MAEIYVLGAGTLTPSPSRFGSAHTLRLGDEIIFSEELMKVED